MPIKKTKIAFITPIYLPANLSGSAVIIKELAEELAKQKFDVTIITSDALTARYWYDPLFGSKIEKKNDTINGVKIYRLSCNQILSSLKFVLIRKLNFLLPKNIKNILEITYNGPHLMNLRQILEKEKFDTIHCSPFPLNINLQVTNAINQLSNKPKLIFSPFFHSEISEFHNPNLKQILNEADRIHVVTHSEKKMIKDLFNIQENKFIVLPLFLNTSKLHIPEDLKKEVEIFKLKYNLINKKIILFAGNKGYMKGAIAVLRAINELYKQDHSYILLAIGNRTQEWNIEIKKIESKAVIDFNYVNEKEKELLFATCNIFCMPSKSESFGLTYLEAWHKKKPVIGADIPAVKELLDNKGLTIKFNDELKLLDTIKLLCNNRKLANKLGQAGYEILNEEYNLDKLINAYKKLFTLKNE